jgi:hypothetical protein
MSTVKPDASSTTGAPVAPGQLGSPVDPQAAAVYLEALGRWREDRRRELDQLDQAALASPTLRQAPDAGGSVTADIMLSLALWKAVSDRYELLVTVWDSGRVGVQERERMSSLIWGRLDATLDPGLISRSTVPGDSALAVSLPEACRLSDALSSQLRVRLGLEVSAEQLTAHIRELRAQMERIREQVDLEPAGTAQQQAAAVSARLARRLKEIVDKAARGGDVGGMLGPFEIEAATFERDLIVGGVRRREAGALVRQAREQRSELEARESALHALVQRCLATVQPAPRYAVPDVEALGPVPNTASQLEPYLHRLGQVGRAMTVAQDAYAKALAEHAELGARLAALRAKATALGVAESADLVRAYAMASTELAARPCRTEIAEQLVKLYQTYLHLETS